MNGWLKVFATGGCAGSAIITAMTMIESLWYGRDVLLIRGLEYYIEIPILIFSAIVLIYWTLGEVG